MRRGYDVTIMDGWFERDDNAEPAVFRLRSIDEVFLHYDDIEHEDLQKKDKAKWNQTQDKLLTMLRAAADEAYTGRLISKEARHVYFKSVTESEVEQGVIYQDPVKDKVIVYFRKFLDIDNHDNIAWRFTDLKDGKIDSEAEELRERLKITRVQPILGPAQLKKYHLNWTSNGIDETDEQHKKYIDNLIEDIIKKLKHQVDQCLKDDHKFSPLFKEVLHHLHLCKKETELFVVRHDILESVKERMFLVYDTDKKLVTEPFDEIQNDVFWKSQHLELDETTFSKKSQDIKAEYEKVQESLNRFGCKFIHSGFFENNDCDPDVNMKELYTQLPEFEYFSRPVVLFGCSGSGKTALMAQIVRESQNWFPNSVSIVRFLGTSLLSFSIKDVLFSICAQIIAIYKINIPSYIDLEKDYQFLVQFFQFLLWKIDTRDRPLVIILDSIDQLKDMNDAHAMHWLPVQLPLNVHIVISMIPSIHCCLQNILGKMPHSEQYLEIPDMPVEIANDMITIRLRAQSRRITKIQRKFVLSKFENCPHPLYLRLLLDQAVTWRSTTVTDDLSVGDDITMAINKYFTNLERKHGEVTTRKTMAYLSASRDGVSVTELEDLLSLSDEVLQDTYIYHLPPNDKHIRIPPSIIAQMMTDVRPYIIVRNVGQFKILSWFHRQFREVCHARYLQGETIMSVHCQLAEYFEGIWFGRVKPLRLYKVKKGEYPNADRGVRPQMIKQMHMYNERKLSELPYHLIKSHQFEKFRNLCGTNFEFLQGVVCAFSVFNAIMMFKLALQTMDLEGEIDSPQVYQDLDNVHKILLLSSENISRDRNNLAIEIISHFGPNYSGSEFLKVLLSNALSSLRDSETPALIPLTRIAPGPESVLKFSITAEVFSRNSDDWNRQYKHVLCVDETKSVLRCIYTIGARRYLYTISLENYGIVKSRHDVNLSAESVVMAGGDRFIVVENSESIELYDASSWKKTPLKYSPVDCLAVSQSGRILAYSAVLFAKVVVCQFGDPAAEPTELFRLDLENILLLMISHDDRILIVIDSEEKLTTYDITTTKVLYTRDIKEGDDKYQHHSLVKEKLTRCVRLTTNNTLIRLDPTTASVCLSDLLTGEHLQTLQASEFGSGDLIAVHASEKLVATVDRSKAGYLNVWRVWNLQTGELVSSPDNAAQLQSSGDVKTTILSMLFFGSDPIFLATIEHQNSHAVKIFYLGTETSLLPKATPYCNLIGHSGVILEMCLAYRDSLLVTVANDNTIKVWDSHRLAVQFHEKFGNNPDPEKVSCHYKNQILTESKTTMFDISRNNKKAFIATDFGQLVIHDIENNTIEHSQKLKDESVKFLFVSSSGRLVVMATSNGNITVLSADDNEVKHRFKHSQNIVNCMAEKNNILVVGTSGMASKGSVWDITSGSLLKEFDLVYSLSVVALTSAGDKIVTSLFEYPLVLSIATDSNSMDMTEVDTAMTAASCVDIDNSDSLALIGSTDGQIRVINLDGKYKFRLGQISSVMTAVFTPDGKRVVSAGYKNIFVWDLDQERLLYRVKKHTNFISKILFDEFGKIMVTASWDKNIAIWDVPSGMSIATYYGHCKLNEVKITCDGGKVLFIPDSVSHIGVLEPNKMLQHMMKGDRTVVRDSMFKVQTLSFSGQKITQLTSQACTIL